MDGVRLVGCCGWCEPQARYVNAYAAIELQTPFYEPPSVELAAKWRTLAPAHFRFSIKAWQLITHTPASPTYRRLKSKISMEERELFGSFRPTEQVWLAWERTRLIAQTLNASVVVFQCPASFIPSRENVRHFRAFFERLGDDAWVTAWEPRGGWPSELVRDLCAEFNLVHCVDPFESEATYGRALYWRLHGRGGYRYRYSDDDLQELQRRIADAPSPAYAMFNNIYMKDDARRFRELLQRTGVPR
jgi:uncharacterized protein YecE (DUF72 family)